MKKGIGVKMPLVALLVMTAPAAHAQYGGFANSQVKGCTLAGIGVSAAVAEVANMAEGHSGMGDRVFIAMMAANRGDVVTESCNNVAQKVAESFDASMAQLGIPITWMVPNNDSVYTPWCLHINEFACDPFYNPDLDNSPFDRGLFVSKAWDVVTRGAVSIMQNGYDQNTAIMSAFAFSGSVEAAATTWNAAPDLPRATHSTLE